MRNKKLHVLNCLFPIVYFLLLLVAVKPELIYHSQQLGFLTSKRFFSEYASYPGGLVEYVSVFLFQFYSRAFWGALVSTIVLFAIFTIAGAVLNKDNSFINSRLKLIPVVFLGILIADYTLPPVFPVMVLMLFTFFLLFKLIIERNRPASIQLILNLLLFTASYYVMGGFMFVVFSGSAIVYLLLFKRKGSFFTIGLILVLFAILPYWAQSILFINSKDAYFKLVPYFCLYRPGFLLFGAIFSLPFIVLIQWSISKIVNQKQTEKNTFLYSEKFQAVQVVIMVAILTTGLLLNIDAKQKHKLNIDYLAYQQRWNELLKLAKNETSTDRLIQFQITRALYHTGGLMEKLFDYPQMWGVDGLILTRHFEEEILLPTTELCFDFGFVNEAIHYGNEAISQNENSPLLIEQLILANIVANKNQAASIYINELKENPFFKKKAIEYEKYIKGYANPEMDHLIMEKRKLIPVIDFKVNNNFPQNDLLNLLDDRPDNKIVYEYLMAYFLLNNDLPSFLKYYPMGKRFSYKKLPKIFQEALILYLYDLSRQGQTLANIKFDKEVASQFKEYLSILKKSDGDKVIARPLLEKKYGNTYWFYVLYNSPVTNNSKTVNE